MVCTRAKLDALKSRTNTYGERLERERVMMDQSNRLSFSVSFIKDVSDYIPIGWKRIKQISAVFSLETVWGRFRFLFEILLGIFCKKKPASCIIKMRQAKILVD